MNTDCRDDTLTRLVVLAAEHGMTVDDYLTRLLDRDPHQHAHRCPTCARLAVIRADAEHPGQMRLFEPV